MLNREKEKNVRSTQCYELNMSALQAPFELVVLREQVWSAICGKRPRLANVDIHRLPVIDSLGLDVARIATSYAVIFTHGCLLMVDMFRGSVLSKRCIAVLAQLREEKKKGQE